MGTLCPLTSICMSPTQLPLAEPSLAGSSECRHEGTDPWPCG